MKHPEASQSLPAFLTAEESYGSSEVQCSRPSPSPGNYWPWWLLSGLQLYFLSTIHMLSPGSITLQKMTREICRPAVSIVGNVGVCVEVS